MRILHTSDWHLGKYLENQSRLDEQEKFIEDLIEIADEKDVDLVVIAGDVYDTSNPPARAEKLFYRALNALAKNGERVVLTIAGNHDNPDRITASTPIAREQGIILLGNPKSKVEKGKIGKNEIIDAGEGYLEIKIKNEKAVILTLPYVSEQRLNEVLGDIRSEEDMQKSYSEKVGKIFNDLSKKFREDTVNIAVSHIFVMGGETSDSERVLQVGGGLTVHADMFPKKAQYIALGHLHKPQKVKNTDIKAYYSGSPLQYSKSEIGYSKCVYIVDVEAGKEAVVQEVLLKNRKPIEVWRCSSIEDAIDYCRENQDRKVWAYLEIETDRILSQSEIKEIKKLKPDILSIIPIIEGIERDELNEERFKEKNIIELFKEFYISERNVEPSEEFMKLFGEIAREEGEEIEAKTS
ncbi:exonuclease SbcCD subunit D [Caminicella sporogenes]|uniref:exonuclease SbcCD subunit D n=1 Tax=Caminicella sporogenes TaxID=166485 RepID=UPI00253FEB28|nr:exonuclease SbcCD subunit D [Caminicella sporogenes]WIF95355.1 exonuclease SbcCD subunit D [Caminicella sporogenes]